LETVAKTKLYEAMFLVDSGDAGSDWDGIIAAIKKMLKRAEVEVVSVRKWDDRRLAYDIRGKSRGTYILCYFRSDGQKNDEIEKAVQLSDRFIRVLILNADWMTEEDIEKDTPATKVEKESQRTSEEKAPEAKDNRKDSKQDDDKADDSEQDNEDESDDDTGDDSNDSNDSNDSDDSDDSNDSDDSDDSNDSDDSDDSDDSEPKVSSDD